MSGIRTVANHGHGQLQSLSVRSVVTSGNQSDISLLFITFWSKTMSITHYQDTETSFNTKPALETVPARTGSKEPRLIG